MTLYTGHLPSGTALKEVQVLYLYIASMIMCRDYVNNYTRVSTNSVDISLGVCKCCTMNSMVIDVQNVG